jgi:hypothetical protein
MASVAMDRAGDIVAGYNISSGTVFPGIRYSSRQQSDPPNRLGTETIVQNGSGTQRCRSLTVHVNALSETTTKSRLRQW